MAVYQQCIVEGYAEYIWTHAVEVAVTGCAFAGHLYSGHDIPSFTYVSFSGVKFGYIADSSADFKHWWRRTSWLGGGSKFVVILAANQGGGVMEWKGPREWAIERDSVRNKKKYVARWGYELEIVDMSTKKRYAHEWRESWEKVDTIRIAMRKYPQAEW